MINGIIFAVNQLGYRHNLIALFLQTVQNPGQCLGRMFRRIMEKDDGAVAHLGEYPLLDFGRGYTFPVQTVNIRY